MRSRVVQKMRRVVSGNYAAAYAALLSRAEFVSAYPITPQTFIVEHIAEFISDGLMDADYMAVESEHSAMSACVSASAAGARTFTATASQGLALMHEVLFTASGLRLPVVMAVVNRSLNSPISIWVEHHDSMPERDSGWMQVYVEDNQEVLDMVIQAYRLAERSSVLLPMMICMDGFLLSHTVEPVEFPEQEEVDDFLPPYKPHHVALLPEDPMVVGPFGPPEYVQEVRYQTDEAMQNAKALLRRINHEFAKKFGRDYGGAIEEYKTDDAEAVLVTLGTVTSTAREVVDDYRSSGKKVGLAKLRFFRPFPTEELRRIAERVGAMGVYDRAVSYGSGGPSFIEVRNALYGHADIPIVGFITGLAGRDVTPKDVELMYDVLLRAAKEGRARREVVWINTRGVES